MIYQCPNCHSYGLGKDCDCGTQRTQAGPGKFTPDDDYVKHRVEYKKRRNEL